MRAHLQKQRWTGDVAEEVEHLLCKHKAPPPHPQKKEVTTLMIFKCTTQWHLSTYTLVSTMTIIHLQNLLCLPKLDFLPTKQ
jgi:hypothetical protein